MTTIVIGPKTRLGREVATRAPAASVLAVARDAADAAAISALREYAGATVVDASADAGALTARVAAGTGPVRLVIAALGPVQAEVSPGVPTPVDPATVDRDLGFVRQVLAAGRPTQVVLVSTVLALAPGEDRRYYAGWKNVVEGSVQQMVRKDFTQGSVTLSVLYPGRLLSTSERKGRLRLHTSYTRLARHVLKVPFGHSGSRVVGWDSKIRLVLTSTSLATRSLRLPVGRS